MAKTSLRSVPDTNVLLASKMTPGSGSSNREYFERWQNEEFTVLFSADTLHEYLRKLRQKGLSEESIREFLQAILEAGVEVDIGFYHLRKYPVDADDIAFLLCAANGEATHLVTYDRHLRDVEQYYEFNICTTTEFLNDLLQQLDG